MCVARRTENRWERKALELRPRIKRCRNDNPLLRVEQSSTRWIEDILKGAGNRWMQMAQDYSVRHFSEEDYVQVLAEYQRYFFKEK